MTWTVPGMCEEIRLNEGGFVDDPYDAGGATNYGISLRFAKGFPEIFDLNHDGKVDRDDIKAMTPAVAYHAYEVFFYRQGHLDELPNASNIAMQLLDAAVNSGTREAIMILQHALGLTVDGELGPATKAACNAAVAAQGAPTFNNRLVAARCRFFDAVVAAHPADAKFVDGWKKRAKKYVDPSAPVVP